MDRVAFSHLEALSRDAWPAQTRSELALFEERVGSRVAQLAEQVHPAAGIGNLDEVDALMHATVRLGDHERVVLVVDHLEAPALGFRHPIDVGSLLWRIRSSAQHAVDLRVLLIARPPAVELAAARDAAFFGDGQWLRLDYPSPDQFGEATDLPAGLLAEILEYTDGHTASTLGLLDQVRQPKSVRASALEQVGEHGALADRTLQHARSIHRLGGHLVVAIANGQGPYEATPDANSKDISSAMRQLHTAGIVRRRRGGQSDWALTDPRVSWVVTGSPAPLPRRVPVLDSRTQRQTTGGLMPGGNDSDRYVVPNKDRGGWDVVKENHGRASAHTDTKKEAVDRAREIIKNEGGGEIRIANKDGQFIDSDTVKGPKRGESPARDTK